MFCKWCGGNIASSDTKCKRCGKEVPALSDCGGFYDLVPNAKKISNVQPEPVVLPVKPASPPRESDPTREVEPVRTKKNSRKSFLSFTVLNVVGFMLVFLMLFVIISKVNQYSSEVNGMRKDLWTIIEIIDFIAEETESVTTEPEAAEPTVVFDPILAEQNVSFTVKIASKDSVQEIEADLDLGDYTDTAVISYDLDEQTDSVNSISCTLKEADTEVLLTIDRNNEFHTPNVSVSYVIEGVAYGLFEAPETYKWQYRFDSDADWVDILADAFNITNGTGKTMRKNTLQELIADNEEEFELRCEISRFNEQGGSLTIVIEGIRFYE